MAADGTYELGPSRGQLLVKTGRAGFGAKAGHDLTFEATRWRGSASVDGGDLTRCSVSLEVEVDLLEVVKGTGGFKPLTDADRADIMTTLRRKILRTAQYPTITFQSTGVTGTAQDFTLTGDLTITGTTRPVTVRGAVVDDRARGFATVAQTAWGIKPYTAMLGALKLADEVTVEFDLALSR